MDTQERVSADMEEKDGTDRKAGGIPPEIAEELRTAPEKPGFMKIVQSVKYGGENIRVSVRPVALKNGIAFQIESGGGRQVRVRNADAAGAAAEIGSMISRKGAGEIHLITSGGDLHVRVTRKGRALVSRSRRMEREAAAMPHDRQKGKPLASFDSMALLAAIGISGDDGSVFPSMRRKYDQVNEFLRIAGETVADCDRKLPFTVVDCGCGKAYLTISLWFYLARVLGFVNARVVGIDRRGDVISAAREMAERLGVQDSMAFVESDLADVEKPEDLPGCGNRVDLVVSLHACDTATDEAIAKAVEWNARYALCAPCCQHEFQKTLRDGSTAPGAKAAFSALLRHGILRERMCDLLTDAFRAAALRVCGYRTNVVEFVSPDATARNIMIRAVRGARPGQEAAVAEYLALRDFWGVAPWLETRLAGRLAIRPDGCTGI